MKKEPIRHHYIPQFILRNFAFDESGRVLYYDKRQSAISVVEPRNIFMVKNLYRDEINNPSEPTQIEHDLAVYENEISHILKEKFFSEREIVLNESEDSKLKLFFAIMGFRSKGTSAMFGENITEESKEMYKHYQHNGDFADLWKRNLGYAVKCRSIQEILNHPDIDDPFKVFFRRDMVGLLRMYFVVVESKEPDEFIIGDCYPVVINGIIDWGLPLHLYSIYPISANRAVLLVDIGAEFVPRYISRLRECVLKQPKYDPNINTIRIRVKALYPEEVQYINTKVAKNANEGFVFKKSPLYLIQ